MVVKVDFTRAGVSLITLKLYTFLHGFTVIEGKFYKYLPFFNLLNCA
jgi:hypothetical protein